MLNFTSGSGGEAFQLHASLTGSAIYLDTFAIMDIAEGDATRRKQFIEVLHSGRADLLFSASNLGDLSGPQGASLTATRAFLDAIGSHWFPVELDPNIVVEREKNGIGPAFNCLSERLLKDLVLNRLTAQTANIAVVSADLFRLGGVLDWIAPQRDSIRRSLAALDDALIKRIEMYRANHLRDATWLDRTFPAVRFIPSKPATFAYINLVRSLVIETARGRKLKKGDGLDFCHGVVACGCASVAVLDKHWKRRIEDFPKPNSIPPILYAKNLDSFISDLHLSTVRALECP